MATTGRGAAVKRGRAGEDADEAGEGNGDAAAAGNVEEGGGKKKARTSAATAAGRGGRGRGRGRGGRGSGGGGRGAGAAALKRAVTSPEFVERDDISLRPLTANEESRSLKIMSWNVNGLRAVVSKNADTLQRLVQQHKPDLLCMQEHKLQDVHVEQFRDLLPGYTSYWNVSREKKGYSGTACFVRGSGPSQPHPCVKRASTTGHQTGLAGFMVSKSLPSSGSAAAATAAGGASEEEQEQDQEQEQEQEAQKEQEQEQEQATEEENRHQGGAACQPVAVSFDMGMSSAMDREGRLITVEYPTCFVINAYVPNSGQKLERLDGRISERGWDVHLRDYMQSLERRGKKVILTGDLNVGHLDLDIWNPTSKSIQKIAGLTNAERDNFTRVMLGSGFRDAFRFLHPTAGGQFSYWSMRANGRPRNRGIRLDYFIVSQDMLPGSEAAPLPPFRAPRPEEEEENARRLRALDNNDREEENAENHTQTAAQPSPDNYPAFEALPIPAVHDSYILHSDTVGVSDHCPVVAVIKTA